MLNYMSVATFPIEGGIHYGCKFRKILRNSQIIDNFFVKYLKKQRKSDTLRPKVEEC